MACYINIEDRYRCASIRERKMQHVWAATAAAVVSVGATAAGGIMSAQAAKKAAGAEASAGKKLRRQEGKAAKQFERQQAGIQQQIQEFTPTPIPEFDLGAATKAATGAAGQMTEYNLAQRRKILPGIEQMDADISNKIQALLGGRTFTADELDALNREIAERGGFNIASAGKMAIPGVAQTSQFNFARALGTKRQEDFMLGFNLQQAWQNSASQFIQGALPVAQFAESAFQGRAQLQQANERMRLSGLQTIADMNTAIYGAKTGAAQTGYKTRQQAASAGLAAGQAQAGMIADTGQAIGQLGGVYSAGIQQASSNKMNQQFLDTLAKAYG